MSIPPGQRTAVIATLRRSRLFADLPPADLDAVSAGCGVRSLARDEILFREGDRAEGFYVLQTGAISVYRHAPDGRERIICLFQPPESFAEACLATIETYPASAVAIEPSRVIVVDRAHFRDLVTRRPQLALQMLASMSLHLKHLVQTLHDLKGSHVEARLAQWLLRHCPAPAPEGTAEFRLPVPKKTIAGQLGVTSATLSRTLARFREEGVITVAGPLIRVLDHAGLTVRAGRD